MDDATRLITLQTFDTSASDSCIVSEFEPQLNRMCESRNQKEMERIPVEILSEIFCEIENGNELKHRPFRRRVKHGHGVPRHLKSFMVPLSQVCQVWREVIHQESSFWVTKLKLGHPNRNLVNADKMISELRALINSSNGSDIDLTIYLFSEHSFHLNWIDTAKDWWLTDILPLHNRIRCLELDIDEDLN